MAVAQLLSCLKDVQSLQSIKAAILVDHEGYHHSEFDWWLFDARETSEKTCPLCLAIHLQMFRGDVVPYVFMYHTHQAVNAIRAVVHPNCRCRLRWTGRTEKAYNTPLGILLPEESREVRFPTEKQLAELSPSLLEELLMILESPWEL